MCVRYKAKIFARTCRKGIREYKIGEHKAIEIYVFDGEVLIFIAK